MGEGGEGREECLQCGNVQMAEGVKEIKEKCSGGEYTRGIMSDVMGRKNVLMEEI